VIFYLVWQDYRWKAALMNERVKVSGRCVPPETDLCHSSGVQDKGEMSWPEEMAGQKYRGWSLWDLNPLLVISSETCYKDL
jgi:hypothetical protein